jgi:spore germination protein YaaH
LKRRLVTLLLLPVLLAAGSLPIPAPVSAQVSYTVVAGDSLYKIARQFQVTTEQLKAQNGLKNQDVFVGQVLGIPTTGSAPEGTAVHRAGRGDTVIVGYYTDKEDNLESSSWSATSHLQSLSWLAPFWFRLNRYDATDIEKAGSFTDEEARRLVNEAHSKGVPVIPVIHNFLYPDKSLTPELVTRMMATPQTRSACINNIVRLIQFYRFDGVNMDFEGIRVSDRDNLSKFYQELGDRLRAGGYTFSVAVPAKSADSMHIKWSAPYDYKAIGRAADKVVLMMYNEHGFPGSGAGPVSSIGFNQAVVKFAMTQMPPQKIILAEPVFGFDFNLNTTRYAYLSHEMVMQRMRDFKAAPVFDPESQCPYYKYTDPTTGQRHEVWYENYASLNSKLNLVRQYDLSGVALWRLGMEDPRIWTTISDRVNVSH